MSDSDSSEKICFDGALPISKRETRLDRLEKSRVQLEQIRSLESDPTFTSLSQDLGRQEIGKLLWRDGFGPRQDTSLTAPFIVPSVIEYLQESKWSKVVSIVPGEAETFCALTAKSTGAAVLSNDSDVTILADMQGNGIVAMLNTLSVPDFDSDRDPSTIRVQCWRPKQLRAKIGTDNLLRVAFQRSEDPTITFSAVLQRSKERRTTEKEAKFARFAGQFSSPIDAIQMKSRAGAGSQLNLNHLDPRLSELVCQLAENKAEPATFRAQDFWVTLPILLEDPSRDASWIYGRDIRQLAYSLLSAAFPIEINSNPQKVIESLRKGQRITQESVEILNPTEQKVNIAIEACISLLAPLSKISNATKARDYIVWSTVTVMNQRIKSGKSVIPSSTIREYLGLNSEFSHTRPLSAPRKTETKANKSSSSSANNDLQWSLHHLNANVQAVLYSLRLLRQVCLFLRNHPMRSPHDKEIELLLQSLQSMPTISDLFLDVVGTRKLMKQTPLPRSDPMYMELFPEDVPSSAHTAPLDASGVHRGGCVAANTIKDPEPMETVRRKKRRKHLIAQAAGGEKRSTGTGTAIAVGNGPAVQKGRFSRNPYDLLMPDG